LRVHTPTFSEARGEIHVARSELMGSAARNTTSGPGPGPAKLYCCVMLLCCLVGNSHRVPVEGMGMAGINFRVRS
jgi:hypothetical protein